MTSSAAAEPSAAEPAGAQGRAPLAEKALEVLDAARRVIDRDGADGLTMRAVSQEAGIPSSLTMYYFGSMAQLEALLLDSLWRDEVAQHLLNLETPPATAAARIKLLVDFHLQIAENIPGFRAYSELITHVLRDRETQQNVAEIYEMYRTELNLPLLRSPEHSRQRSQAFSAVMLAAGEGLPIGRLFGATDSSMRDGFQLLAELFTSELGAPHAAQRTGDAPPSRTAPLTTDRLSAPTELRPAEPTLGSGDDAPPTNATARKLLVAGSQLLHRGGLRKLSFSAISEASGEAKSLVSYHFKSKQGFIDALVRTLLEEWSVEVHHALITEPEITPATLSTRLFAEDSPLVSLIMIQPALRNRPGLQARANSTYAHFLDSLSTRFPQDLGPGPAATSAALFIGTLNGLALQSRYDPTGFDLNAALGALLHLLPPRNN